MNTFDYIIVGQGIAGTALAQKFYEEGKSFFVIDKTEPSQSSRVASGIWNPVVLKRMKKIWLADEMINTILPFYKQAESLFNKQCIETKTVVRLFARANETNQWVEKCDDPNYAHLLNLQIKFNSNLGVKHPFGFGEVFASGRINTVAWLDAARAWLENKSLLLNEELQFNHLKIGDDQITYKGISGKAIIFCEGMYAAFQNPFFKTLPFELAKGEVLIIESEFLNLDYILNSGIFILPLGNNRYKIGATYAWQTTDTSTTEAAKKELILKLDKIITVPYKVISQQAGIRPTTNDRRPLLGTSQEHKNVHIFNGLGTRGVLLAPYLSQMFVDYLLREKPLLPEADIRRYFK